MIIQAGASDAANLDEARRNAQDRAGIPVGIVAAGPGATPSTWPKPHPWESRGSLGFLAVTGMTEGFLKHLAGGPIILTARSSVHHAELGIPAPVGSSIRKPGRPHDVDSRRCLAQREGLQG